MAFKEIHAIGSVDPQDHLFQALWVVYGQYEQAPQILAVCCNIAYDGKATIWGYSQYKNKAAYRTIGQNLESWIKQNTCEKFVPKFFIHQACALDYIRKLTEPRCEPISPR